MTHLTVAHAGDNRLYGRLDLAVIDTGAVERNKRHAATMLDVVNQDSVDPAFHISTS
ncbi:hypothetical protein [Arthrobacter sp. UYEF20]|uniref:hypothetical protein n=1 Tax=Arthrobacter sp. UYEF20 TaxID=1756363 RepID=UPI0033977F8A